MNVSGGRRATSQVGRHFTESADLSRARWWCEQLLRRLRATCRRTLHSCTPPQREQLKVINRHALPGEYQTSLHTGACAQHRCCTAHMACKSDGSMLDACKRKQRVRCIAGKPVERGDRFSAKRRKFARQSQLTRLCQCGTRKNPAPFCLPCPARQLTCTCEAGQGRSGARE